MDTTKSITLLTFGIIAIAISMLIIKWITNKLKSKSNVDHTLNISLNIWIGFLVLAYFIILGKSLVLLNEGIDNILNSAKTNILWKIVQTSSVFWGLTLVWFFVWYFISGYLTLLLLNTKSDSIEADRDNWSYFLTRGIILVGAVFVITPVFEILLRIFIPSIEIPFYH
jgi:hypothetical protein